MPKLIHEQNCTSLGRTEWWDLGFDVKATVQVDEPKSSVSLTRNKNSITKIIAEKILHDSDSMMSRTCNITQSAWGGYLIEYDHDSVDLLLKEIEKILPQLYDK